MPVRLIKLALISFVLLFLVATAISLMIPSHIRISKAINIHGDRQRIFALLADTLLWKRWHPAFVPGARSFQSVQIIPEKITDSTLIMRMQQGKKTAVTNGWQLYHIAGDSLTLQWYMDFHLKWYPWQKFGSLFYENTYGVMMEQGLSNIKNEVQKPVQ